MKKVKMGAGGMENLCDTLHCFYLRVRFFSGANQHAGKCIIFHFYCPISRQRRRRIGFSNLLPGTKRMVRRICVFFDNCGKNATDLVQMKTIEEIEMFEFEKNAHF